MEKRIKKMFSMYESDAARLEKLAAKNGVTESKYIRELLKNAELAEKAKDAIEDELEKTGDEGSLRIMPNISNEKTSDESEDPNDEDREFSSNKLAQEKEYSYTKIYDREKDKILLVKQLADDPPFTAWLMNEGCKKKRFKGIWMIPEKMTPERAAIINRSQYQLPQLKQWYKENTYILSSI